MWLLLTPIKWNTSSTFILPDGTRFDYPFRSSIGRLLYVGTGFEVAELAYLLSAVRPGDIVLDVGANAGYYTVPLARRVGPSGHVYAFEPGQRELDLLRRNLCRYSLENVSIIPKAVSDTDGSAPFFFSHEGAMSSFRRTPHPDQQIYREDFVDTTTLDSFVREAGLSHVDVWKMDIEGAEMLAFRGGTSVLKMKPRVILFEAAAHIASAFGYSVEDIFALVRSAGYDIYFFEDGAVKPVDPSDERHGKIIHNYVALPH